MMMKRNMRDHLHSFYNPVSHRAKEKQSDSFQMKSETSPSPKQINPVLASQRGWRLWIPYENEALFWNKVRIWRSKDSWPRASPKNVQRGCRSLLAKVLKVKQRNQRLVTRSWNVKNELIGTKRTERSVLAQRHGLGQWSWVNPVPLSGPESKTTLKRIVCSARGGASQICENYFYLNGKRKIKKTPKGLLHILPQIHNCIGQ